MTRREGEGGGQLTRRGTGSGNLIATPATTLAHALDTKHTNTPNELLVYHLLGY